MSVALDLKGELWEALNRLDAANMAAGFGSHTTERMRRELLFFALDNNWGGPLVEVGTMNGGLTSLFGLIATHTARRCVGIDIDPARLEQTRQTCAEAGVEAAVDLFHGSLHDYVATAPRLGPDLMFIDSSHHYGQTMSELRTLHNAGWVPRALAFHDFSYRIEGFLPGQTERDMAIAVDYAVRDFYGGEYSGPPPIMKRVGALTGDGMQATPANPGAVQHDYVDWHGSEGIMILFPADPAAGG